jgi:cellulose synthase/poly-beta-1,6-N-acetylglucosamine synthase-like glycosyltransferase
MASVSVVITTYNRAQLLPRAIESAQQAGSDLEVIVVDDCSTDETPDVCASLNGIRYVRLSSNKGLANARNVGIAESSSEYIAFLDDDDLRLPNSIQGQLRTLESDPRYAFCYGPTLIADSRRQLPTGEVYPLECPQGDIYWELLENNFVPMPSVLARKSSLLELDCFNRQFDLTADWDMWLRLSERWLVAAVDEPVAIYRKAIAESEQMCSNPAELCKEGVQVQRMALNSARARTGSRKQRNYVKRKFRDTAYEILMAEATSSLHDGNTQSARANIVRAFRFRPFRTLVSGWLPWLIFAERWSN